MGLTSLPILNKLGYNNSWQNLFYSNKFTPIYFSRFFMIETLLNRLSEERFFYDFFEYKESTQRRYTVIDDIRYSLKTVNTFTGEVWFLLYSSSLIISPLFFNTNMVNERRIKLKVNSKSLVFLFLEDYDEL